MKSCKNQNKTSNEEEKAKEVTRGRGEAELALEPTQIDTRKARTTLPPKEGFSLPIEHGEPTHRGNVGGRRDHRRPNALRKEKEGRQMFRGPLGTGERDDSIHYETSRNLKDTYVNFLSESSRSTPAGVKELARRTGPAPGASAMMEGRMAALEADCPRTPRWRRAASQRASPRSSVRWRS